MPFDPTLPLPNSPMNSAEMRAQFNALHAEATAPETDPAFTASEAALFVPGDKAKLDAADTAAARDTAIAAALAGVPTFGAHYVRVRLPRASGPQAGLAFTVFAP